MTTISVILTVAIVLVFPVVTAYIGLVERKILADFQVRLGPMRVGPHGLLQPIADAIKLLQKEDIIPAQADQALFWMAPIISVFTALTAFAVLPFSERLRVADVNVGLLVISAMASVGILGIILGGWSSNSHYPLLGALRSAAQLVSYEVALALALLSAVMSAGTLSMVGIVHAQQHRGVWFVFDNYGFMLVPFMVFLISSVAESNRTPFDLPEAESELVAGFHTEFSGLRWAFFMLGEYAHLFVVASVVVTLFWGGWLRPFPSVPWLAALDYGFPFLLLAGSGAACFRMARRQPAAGRRAMLVLGALVALAGAVFLIPAANAWLAGPFWFFLKVGVILYLMIWLRGTFPRFRYDQLMNIGWKYMVPIGLGSILVNALLGVWRT